jgi:hypothetical protein
MAVLCCLWSFGIFDRFGMFEPRKSGNSAFNAFHTYNTYLMQQKRPHFLNFGETLQFKSAF